MTLRFDPNFAPYIEGAFVGDVVVSEVPDLGFGNLVIDPSKPFDISMTWKVFGSLSPLWLTALSVASPDWVVTAYAEPVGPGTPVTLGSVNVATLPAVLTTETVYTATITAAANQLREENPGDPTESGVYRLLVTAFLNSAIPGGGYDLIGYAEGPVIKAENLA